MEEWLKYLPAVRDTGITGIFTFLAFMWWSERKDGKERTRILIDYTKAITQLTDAINNFQRNCIDIQRRFQEEVDRMRKRE